MTKKKKTLCGWFNLITLLWIIISEHCINVFCLKDLKIFIPEAVIMGSAATLSCQYDLEEAPLYSVRWYFQGEEFYRHVPKESPPAIVFPVSKISIDLSLSDSTSVTLRSVTRELSGLYQCEVSEDAPYFHTDIRAAKMQVVELPTEDPLMQIDKKVITAADHFKAACTVGPSFPAANITWFLNGRKIYKTPFQRILYRAFEGTPTFSSLEMYPHSKILQDIFQTAPQLHNSITVLCEISILHIYHNNVQQKIMLNLSPTTVSPNLLGLEGSKITGDPDNSPLTGLANCHLYDKNHLRLFSFMTFSIFMRLIVNFSFL